MDRRRVLRSVQVVLGGLLAGCVGDEGVPAEDDDSTESGPNGTSVTVNNSSAVESGTNDTSDEDEDSQTEEPRQDPVYLRNGTAEEAAVRVVVERETDGEVLLKSEYVIPPETGLEIPQVGAVGNTYTVTAEHNGTVEEREWTVRKCPEYAEAGRGGATPVEVGIKEGGHYIASSMCDTGSPLERLPHEPHEEHRAD